MGSGGSKSKNLTTNNPNKPDIKPESNQINNSGSSAGVAGKPDITPESNQINNSSSSTGGSDKPDIKRKSNQINNSSSSTGGSDKPDIEPESSQIDNHSGSIGETDKSDAKPDTNQTTVATESDAPQTPPANTAGGKLTPRKETKNEKTLPVSEKQELAVEDNEESTKGDKSDTVKGDNCNAGDVPPSQTEDIAGTLLAVQPSESNEIKSKTPEISEDRVIPPDPEDQRKFDDALEFACLLVKPENVMKKVTNNVTKLELHRALPLTFSLHELLTSMSNLQELDLRGNNLGPQSFRSICLAMCNNSTVHSLNLASNHTDTDSAECIGRLLTVNKTLEYLDVSSNYLGKDFFSRNVGPALKTNTALKTLRTESIGSTDVRLLMEGLLENQSLTEIDFSGNCVTDRTALGKGFAAMLKKPDCCVQTLALSNCEMSPQGLEALRTGLTENKSLCQLNLNGNEVQSLQNLMKIAVTLITHPRLLTFCMDSSKVKDKTLKNDSDLQGCVRADTQPVLQILSLTDCSLTNEFWEMLAALVKGRQLPIREIDLGANGDLTSSALKALIGITSDEVENISTLRKVTFSLITQADGLADQLTSGQCPNLQYLNVRKSRMSDVQNIGVLYKGKDCVLKTLILDGQKLANTDSLSRLLDNAVGGSLTTLSIEGCSLTADDISPLCQSLQKGLALHMLKVSGNRLEDRGVIDLVEAVLSNKTHPLAVLDVSSNTMGDEGATCLTKLFTTKKHKSQLHSLNVSVNNVAKAGILSLVSVIGGKFPLRTLYIQSQSNGLTEPEMEEIFSQLAKSLGFMVNKTGETIQQGSSELPNLPEGLRIKLSNLGGDVVIFRWHVFIGGGKLDYREQNRCPAAKDIMLYTGLTEDQTPDPRGETGMVLDCPRIVTDYTQERLPSLSFAHSQIISAHLKGTGSDMSVWSAEEWKLITGANKPTCDTPSWLQCCQVLKEKLLRQGYVRPRLVRALKKFYGRHHELVKGSNRTICQIIQDILATMSFGDLTTSRDLAVYLSNLPGSSTTQKMEALLEMEADCNLDEICLMKDPVTRGVNGVGWGLMCDKASVQKAVDFFNSGEAKVFGQPIMICPVQVHVDDEINALTEAKAREDQDKRIKQRQSEDRAHRNLIRRTTEESWKRHEYRLAHPAYADGRIW